MQVFASVEFRGTYPLDFEWKANSTILMTSLVSVVSWLVFVIAVTSLQNQVIGTVFLVIAVLSLLRFGQLLDRRLEGAI